MGNLVMTIVGDGIQRTRRKTSIAQFVVAAIGVNVAYWIFVLIVNVFPGLSFDNFTSGDPKLMAGAMSQGFVFGLVSFAAWTGIAVAYLGVTYVLRLQSRWSFALMAGACAALVQVSSAVINGNFEPITLASAAEQFAIFTFWAAAFHQLAFEPIEAEAA